tara:strand:+ start:323 stop:517 length:195 start_codon:yes stop_codon:yes gene_type:complete
MEIDFLEVWTNFEALEEEDKIKIREVMNSPLREIIGKVFGPEFDRMLGQFATAEAPTRRGLAAR